MTRQEYNREASSQATCNWVEVRNQAAIAAMQGMLANPNIVRDPTINIEEVSVAYANALVKLLKEE